MRFFDLAVQIIDKDEFEQEKAIIDYVKKRYEGASQFYINKKIEKAFNTFETYRNRIKRGWRLVNSEWVWSSGLYHIPQKEKK